MVPRIRVQTTDSVASAFLSCTYTSRFVCCYCHQHLFQSRRMQRHFFHLYIQAVSFCFSYFEAVFETAGLYHRECQNVVFCQILISIISYRTYFKCIIYFGESKDQKYNHSALSRNSFRVKGIVSSKSIALIPSSCLSFFLNSKENVLNFVQLGYFFPLGSKTFKLQKGHKVA